MFEFVVVVFCVWEFSWLLKGRKRKLEWFIFYFEFFVFEVFIICFDNVFGFDGMGWSCDIVVDLGVFIVDVDVKDVDGF